MKSKRNKKKKNARKWKLGALFILHFQSANDGVDRETRFLKKSLLKEPLE